MENLDDSKLNEALDREFADRMTGDYDPVMRDFNQRIAKLEIGGRQRAILEIEKEVRRAKIENQDTYLSLAVALDAFGDKDGKLDEDALTKFLRERQMKWIRRKPTRFSISCLLLFPETEFRITWRNLDDGWSLVMKALEQWMRFSRGSAILVPIVLQIVICLIGIALALLVATLPIILLLQFYLWVTGKL